MLKRVLLVIATSALSACASDLTSSSPLDATATQRQMDSTACTQQARTNPVYPPSSPLHHPAPNFDRDLARVDRAARIQASIYDHCMQAKGYARTR